MPDTQDMDLVREFARSNSEAAFTELVRRHIALVYSVARRCTGNDGDAQDVTQAVFIILARKAAGLRDRTLLPGWLYETTRFTATRLLRNNARRHAREQEAFMQSTLNEAGTADIWERLSPHLEAAMSKLAERDRALLVLRFYQNKSSSQAAALMGIREDAAQKRVRRAIEKLRKFFTKRGVDTTAATIAETISANSIQAAPLALAKTVTAVALAKGGAASISTSTLIKGALKIMAWSKVKTAIVVSACVLLAVGTTTVAIKKFAPVSAEDVFTHPDDNHLAKAPPVVILRPNRHPVMGNRFDHMHGPPFSVSSERFVGLSQPLNWVISVAFDIGPERMMLPPDLPVGRFDFLSAVPNDPKGALREEIQRQFGLVAHTEIQPRDVLLLKVTNPDAPSLKINESGSTDHGIQIGAGRLTLVNFAMSGSERVLKGSGSGTAIVRTNIDDSIVNVLGGYFLGVPVIDETGLTNSYDIDLQWDGKLKGNNQTKAIESAVRDRLGLELVPTNMPIQVLVVEYQDGHQVEPRLQQAAWAPVGFDTPEAAFQSGLAAMSKGDVKTYQASLTPDYQKRFLQSDAKGKSQSQIAAHLQHNAAEVVAFQVIAKEALSDDEVVLYVRSARLGNGQVTMKKVNGKWKFDEDIH